MSNVSKEVSEYMRSLAKKSHAVVLAKYGKEYYKNLVAKRKDRQKPPQAPETQENTVEATKYIG